MQIASFFSKSGKGSVLLEIAIGISVLSIISGFIIRKTISTNKYMREQITRSNINTTVIAISAFVANNKRLPRPSEDTNGTESTQNIRSGFIPYRVLGISEKTAKDGKLRPLIYTVEPLLTSDFEQIYPNDMNENCFCKNILSPAIRISGNDLRNDVIAFVVDTQDNKTEENTVITPSKHTVWISRDMLLMKYLKNSPCQRENAELQDYHPLDF